MGKYMKKSKLTGEVGVMEVSQPTTLGVRTRAAKALALQRLNSSTLPATKPEGSAVSGGSSCYLQLRSRRLEKSPLLTESKKQQRQQRQQRQQGSEVGESKESGSMCGVKSGTSDSGLVPAGRSCDGDGCFDDYRAVPGYEGDSVRNGFSGTEGGNETTAEASFGEDNMDFETRHRSTRESTPCNIVGDLHAMVTPGSSSSMRQRDTLATIYRNGRDNNTSPTARELEEFFVYAEEQQHRLFMEKYNFDVVNDLPLPGRYEWAQVVP